ncbi:hypothetical protein Tco_1071869 [Tanacetum coccineum]
MPFTVTALSIIITNTVSFSVSRRNSLSCHDILYSLFLLSATSSLLILLVTFVYLLSLSFLLLAYRFLLADPCLPTLACRPLLVDPCFSTLALPTLALPTLALSTLLPTLASRPLLSTVSFVSNSVTTNDHAKLIESNKVENGNDHKSANIYGKVESNKTESGCYQQPSNIFGKSVSKDGKGNDEKAANIFGNLDVPASTAGTPTNGISTTTTRTPASTPTPVIPSCVPALGFGFGSAPSTTPTISVAETGNTSVINDKDLKSNSPFASTPFSTTTTTTTTTTGSGLFGFSSTTVTSTTKNHSKASFFNVSN